MTWAEGDERNQLGWPAPAQADAASDELGVGSRIGGYRLEAVAGRGGMGTVYRATQLALGRTVALKVIATQFAADPAFRERFRRESQLAASLDHPNIVTIYEAGEDAGRLFVSMRLVDGLNLRQIVDAEGPLPAGRAVAVVAQVAAALDAAHVAGLVHRDVKPANILTERRAGTEHAYLSDFGLVKRVGADPELTGTAGWVGSVDYVAPEQVYGGPVDARTDIYALGVVLYVAVTGLVPFPRADIASKLYATVNEGVPAIRLTRPDVPAELDSVVARATAKDPAARFASAGELAGAARRALSTTSPSRAESDTGPEGVSATAPLPAPASLRSKKAARGRQWIWAGAAVAALVAIVAVGLVAAAPSGHHARPIANLTGTRPGSGPPAGGGGQGAGVPVAKGPHGALTVDAVAGTRAIPDRYHLSIYDLRRSGPYVIVDFGIVCAQADPSMGCGTESDFGSARSHIAEGFNTVGGLALIDPMQHKEYSEVTDSQDRPYCSAIGAFTDIGPAVHLAWATFPAPPPSVSSMDIVFPEGGPQVPGVPITTGGPSDLSKVATTVIPANPAGFSKPVDPNDTTGLKLRVLDLVSSVGNPSGSDADAPGHSTITLNADVLFDFNQANLSPAAKGILSGVAAKIKGGGNGTVAVTGYTDSIGPDSVNNPLSQARAQAVVAALTPQVAGVPVTLQAAGQGAAEPVAPNTNPDGSDNPAGRAQNRRVSISFNTATAPAASAPPPSAAPAAPVAHGPQAVDYTANDPGTAHSQYHIVAERLVREGPFLVLHLTVTCTGLVPPDGDHCNGVDDFAGTDSVPPISEIASGGGNVTLAAAGGIYLTDPAAKQIYDVVHNSTDHDTLTADVNPLWPLKNSYPLWLYFPAPPSSVTSLTVNLPDAVVQIPNLPIS